MKQQIAYTLLNGLAEVIRAVSRPDNRYAITFKLVDRLGRWVSWIYFLGGPTVYRVNPTAEVLNHVLCYYTRRKIAFTLPVEVHDLALVQDALQAGRGAIIATAHTRLSCAVHKGLLQHGIQPVFVGLTGASSIKYNWGHDDPVVSIYAASRNLFAELAGVLRAGHVVVPYVDYRLSHARRPIPTPVGISPNAFVWAAHRNVPVLLMTNRIDQSGTIHVALHKPDCIANTPTARGHEMAHAMGGLMKETLGWDFQVIRPKYSLKVLA